MECHIAIYRQRASTQRLYLISGPLQSLRIDIGYQQIRAGLSKSQRHRPAHAARRASHQRHPAFQTEEF